LFLSFVTFGKRKIITMPGKRILVIPLIIMSLTLQAQIFDPVTWEFGYEKKGEGIMNL